jgi:hypothetical protein
VFPLAEADQAKFGTATYNMATLNLMMTFNVCMAFTQDPLSCCAGHEHDHGEFQVMESCHL